MFSITLEILEGDRSRSVTLSLESTKSPQVIRIGRSAADCDVVLTDKKVSRLHGEIFFKKEEYTFYLRNLTSHRPNSQPNPVWVNSQTIIDREVALRAQTQIQLGQVLLKVLTIDIPQNGIKCVNGHTVPYTYKGYFCPHCGSFLESGSTVAVSSSQFLHLQGESNAARN
ncbi:MAG: FHA domain-containing protein [Xenococcaceae cyanobacterium MO_234.B1]|nr:FHA domain-containing protein [Xenococcaceae cyanobacterium MO_234.B1]